ncbi:unnamed protein product [Phytophthora fragariaefolia]|uniref:Unnamed protein product n=1 Tax=Phytophthora fragariaefolia TaxID=1490495 RepID=A0A9W6Y0A5_9STRA|nr:unnamed protein product [Phytophthora fragariaefolia]
MQTKYVYDETVSGKGTDQINSMLQHFIRTTILPSGKKKLVVYADNCSGQNKNNLVIMFLLAQVQMGLFERVDYTFFVKGHTKNSCERGFGHIRKHVGRQDLWTMDQVVAAVTASAVSNATVHSSRGDDFFMHYKPLVTELYKNLSGVQQFQIFTMESSKPGVVQCRKGPDSEVEEQDLRRKIDGVLTEASKVERMFAHFRVPVRPHVFRSHKEARRCRYNGKADATRAQSCNGSGCKEASGPVRTGRRRRSHSLGEHEAQDV